MIKAGYRFVMRSVCNEFAVDTGPNGFAARWPQLKTAGLIRGAYDLVHVPGQVYQFCADASTDRVYSITADTLIHQADQYIGAVKRLVPGDLGPTLDLEDRIEAADPHLPEEVIEPCHNPHPLHALNPFDNAHNRGFWVNFAHDYLDRVEAALGRQPVIYTSRSWWQQFTGMSREFTDYPLWVVRVNFAGADPLVDTPRLPWSTWAFWQWHYEGSRDPMPPLFTDRGVDLNRFNGSIWQLRGMADLGRTAPYNSSGSQCVAFVETDGHVHLLSYTYVVQAPRQQAVWAWRDDDLTFPATQRGFTQPDAVAAGDPSAVAIAGREYIVYRSLNGLICYYSRSATAPSWGLPQVPSGVAPVRAISDPSVFVNGRELHIVCWGEDDHLWHLWWNGAWHSADMTHDLGSPNVSGNPVPYTLGGVVHAVSRAGRDGHLHDLWSDAGRGRWQDITHDSTPPRGAASTPAATYTPTVYYSAAAPGSMWPRIVFRAVRGKVWEIARDTLQARNLSDEGGGPPTAAGSPDAFVVNRAVHIVYRGVDGHIYDLAPSTSGTWRYRDTGCPHSAAADPRAFVVSGGAGRPDVGFVIFRGVDGGIYRLTLEMGRWTCDSIMV